MWPLLVRELRVQARSRLHFGLRLAGAGTLMIAFLLFWWRSRSGAAQTGSGWFGLLARLSMAVIWFIGPFLTADCIARERREGTLGLLWLTPLRPWQVVLAKSLARTVGGFTLLAAAIPVFAIPLLMGGVGWPDVVRLLLLQVSALALSLSAGLVASSVALGWWTTRIAGACVNVVLLGIFLLVYHAAWVLPAWWAGQGTARATPLIGMFQQRLFLWTWQGKQMLSGLDSGWMPTFPPASWRLVFLSAGIALLMILLSMAVGGLSALGMANALRRQARGESGRTQRLRGRQARAGSWLHLGVATAGTLYLVATLVDWPTVDHLRETGRWAAWTLAVSAAVWGGTRFRREWESGVWELLAVVPGGLRASIARTLRSGGWIWVGAGGGFIFASHLVGVLAVESAAPNRYPWWLAGWMCVQGSEALLLPWAALGLSAWIARGGRRPEFAVAIALGALFAGFLLIEPAVTELLGWMQIPWPGRWGEPWLQRRGGSVGVADAALAGLIRMLWWLAAGMFARHRALAGRGSSRQNPLRASPAERRPGDRPDE